MCYVNKLKSIQILLEEIIEKQIHLETLFDMWENGSPEEQACSDPAMQYCLEGEIQPMVEDLKNLVNEL